MEDESKMFVKIEPPNPVLMIFSGKTRKHNDMFRVIHDNKLKILKVGPLVAKQLEHLEKGDKFTISQEQKFFTPDDHETHYYKLTVHEN